MTAPAVKVEEKKPVVPEKVVEVVGFVEKEKELKELEKAIDIALNAGNVEKANDFISKYAKIQAEIETEKREAAKKEEAAAKAKEIADARARFEAMKK